MKTTTQTLGLLLLGTQMNLAFGFSTGSCSVTRSFNVTSAVTNSSITVSAVLTNGDGTALRGFYFVDQIPAGLSVKTIHVTLNGQSVTNYTFEVGAAGEIYDGYVPYRWILETPPAFAESNGVPPTAIARIDYSVTAPKPGSFALDNFSWAGFDPGATNVWFGYSEGSDSQTLSFVTAPPAPFPLLVLSSSVLNFFSGQGSVSAPQGLGIQNWGTGALNWTASVGGNSPAWISVSPGSGADATNVMVTAAGSSLAPGTYTNTLTITAGSATNSPQTVTAILTVNPSIPSQGLLGYWAFDEGAGSTAVDASGNGRTLSLVNNPSWTTGQLNGAVSFNGINNYAVIPSLDLSSATAVTVAFWLKRSYNSSEATVLLEASPDFNVSQTGFMLFPDGQHGLTAGLNGNRGYNINSYDQPSSAIWHHLAIVYDKSKDAGSEVTVFIDGALQTANAQVFGSDNTNPFGTNPLYLFSRAGYQEFCQGAIDELRIYNRALSATEVSQLFLQPYLQLGSANAGLQKNRFRFSISGSADLLVVVESCTNLMSPVWTPVATNTISGVAPYFYDNQWTNFASRFYRVRSP